MTRTMKNSPAARQVRNSGEDHAFGKAPPLKLDTGPPAGIPPGEAHTGPEGRYRVWAWEPSTSDGPPRFPPRRSDPFLPLRYGNSVKNQKRCRSRQTDVPLGD